jgi:hypothetical protein
VADELLFSALRDADSQLGNLGSGSVSTSKSRRELRKSLETEYRSQFINGGARAFRVWVSEWNVGAEVRGRSAWAPAWWTKVRYAKRRWLLGAFEPYRALGEAVDDLRAGLDQYLEAGQPPPRWSRPSTPLPLLGVAFGGLASLIGAIGQPVLALTYLGWLSVEVAGKFAISALTAGIAFIAIWLIVGIRTKFAETSQAEMVAGTPAILTRSLAVFGCYAGLAFFCLVVLTFDQKGLDAASGHFYIRHLYGSTEISSAEYSRQLAYRLWAWSAWSLALGTYVISMSLRPFVRRWQPGPGPRPALRASD